jgi:hypothetical protein
MPLPPGKLYQRSGSRPEGSNHPSRLLASSCDFGRRLTLAGSWQGYSAWSSPMPARSTGALPPSSWQSHGPSPTPARVPSSGGNTGEAWRRPGDALLASTRCAKTDLLLFFITKRRLECKEKIQHRVRAYSLHDPGPQDKKEFASRRAAGPRFRPWPSARTIPKRADPGSESRSLFNSRCTGAMPWVPHDMFSLILSRRLRRPRCRRRWRPCKFPCPWRGSP